MKGYRVGSQWYWERVDGHRTQVTVTKSLKTRVHLRANISGFKWSTRQVSRLHRLTCHDCKGTGRVTDAAGDRAWCPECGGSGR